MVACIHVCCSLIRRPANSQLIWFTQSNALLRRSPGARHRIGSAHLLFPMHRLRAVGIEPGRQHASASYRLAPEQLASNPDRARSSHLRDIRHVLRPELRCTSLLDLGMATLTPMDRPCQHHLGPSHQAFQGAILAISGIQAHAWDSGRCVCLRLDLHSCILPSQHTHTLFSRDGTTRGAHSAQQKGPAGR